MKRRMSKVVGILMVSVMAASALGCGGGSSSTESSSSGKKEVVLKRRYGKISSALLDTASSAMITVSFVIPLKLT